MRSSSNTASRDLTVPRLTAKRSASSSQLYGNGLSSVPQQPLDASQLALLRAQRSQLLLRLLGEGAIRELLEVELDLVRVGAVLDLFPELLVRLAARLAVAGGFGRLRGFLGRPALENELQVSAERSRGLIALIGRLGERALDDAIDHRRNLHQLRRPHRIVLDDLLREREARAIEGLLPREELKEKSARREDVGAPIDSLPLDLLGRHVRGRAHHRAGARRLALVA